MAFKQLVEKRRKGVPHSSVTRAMATAERKVVMKIDGVATPSRSQDWPVTVARTGASERIYGVLIEYQSDQEVVIGAKGTYKVRVVNSVALSDSSIGMGIVSASNGEVTLSATDSIGYVVDWDNTNNAKWVIVDLP